jgi:hypothetical protein
MRNGTKLVIGFSLVGFILPLIGVAFYSIAAHFNVHPSTTPALYLCPTSFILIALGDHASVFTGVIAWLMICVSNAVLYAVVPFAIVVVFGISQPTWTTEDHGEAKDR